MCSISSRVVRPWFRRSVFESAPLTFAVPRKGERLFADKTKGNKSKKIIKTNIASGMLLRQFKGALSGKCYGSGQPNQV